MATTKGETVEEREEAVRELLLLEPEILAWLESTDRNVGNDSSADGRVDRHVHAWQEGGRVACIRESSN